MEKYFKIILPSILSLILLQFPYWSVAVTIAFICAVISIKNELRSILLVLPVFFICASVAIGDMVSTTLWHILLYFTSQYCSSSIYSKRNLLCGVLLLITIYYTLPSLWYCGTMMFVLLLPPIKYSKYTLTPKVRCFVLVFIAFITFTMLILPFILNAKERKCAYLTHGVWCKASPEYLIDSISNSSAYSYSELCRILNADNISTVDEINKYTELWIMTPTKPFSEDEKGVIVKWVRNGGSLILGSDHTDLYGHGRVLNDLLQYFDSEVSYTAVFRTSKDQYFSNHIGQDCPLKTPNSIKKSVLAFPLLSMMGWEERAYYDNANFFGPLEANANNEYFLQTIVSQRQFGLGRITLLADTTFCANFAIYQPYVERFLQCVISFHIETLLIIIIPFLLLLLLLVNGIENFIKISICSLIIPILISSTTHRTLDNNIPRQIWTGNKTFVLENVCPFACVSTAYSLSALTGKAPIWKDEVDITENDVIWVDSVTPPNPKWRWIKITDEHNHFYSDGIYPNEFEELYKELGALEVRSYESIFSNYKTINTKCIINDAVMNDWWYGNFGISNIRKARINAWLDWLSEKPLNAKYTYYTREQFSDSVYTAVLNIKDKNIVKLDLPVPNVVKGEEVNFGCGIIGKVIENSDESVKILGLHEFSENWDCPSLWSLTYSIK